MLDFSPVWCKLSGAIAGAFLRHVFERMELNEGRPGAKEKLKRRSLGSLALKNGAILQLGHGLHFQRSTIAERYAIFKSCYTSIKS